jgi:hypothetical protein
MAREFLAKHHRIRCLGRPDNPVDECVGRTPRACVSLSNAIICLIVFFSYTVSSDAPRIYRAKGTHYSLYGALLIFVNHASPKRNPWYGTSFIGK